MIDNLLMLNLRSPFLDDSKIYAPMANLYLKSFLNAHAPQTNVWLGDDNYSIDDLVSIDGFDAIGLSIMTPQREEAKNLARAIKQRNPKITLIAGGPHVKHYTKDVVDNPDFDFVVPLDGEVPLTQIVQGNAQERVITHVMSKADILNAPRPDRTSKNAIELLKQYHYTLGDRQSTTMMTARGCVVGETLVNTVEGKIPIKELVGREKVGVLTWDEETDQVVATDAVDIRVTRKNASLVRIHLSDGTHIDCTPDHPFMVIKNGNQHVPVKHIEREAKDLKPKDWLKSISEDSQKTGHITLSWGRRKRRLLHRIIAEYKEGRRISSDEQVHHIDKNPKNNHIENLEIVKSTKEHFCKYHKEISERMQRNNPSKKDFVKGNIKPSNYDYKGGDTRKNKQVVKVEYLENKEDVYNLEVPFNHWFFANDTLIHNCPEQCTFCEDAMTAVKWSSLESLTAQMDDIKALGYGGVYIFDDLFAIALPKVRPIAEELRKHDLIYRCNAQARYFTKWGGEMANLLADTGCYEIAFGAESGSQKILNNIHKRTTVEQNYETVRLAKQAGLKVKAFILLGLPGEDWSTLRETERFVRDAGFDDFQAAVYMPFKGTQIRESIDSGERVDLFIEGKAKDGDVTGAYGIRGGQTSYEVRTKTLSGEDLQGFRDYLVDTYRPKSHEKKWSKQDKFFDQAHVGENKA